MAAIRRPDGGRRMAAIDNGSKTMKAGPKRRMRAVMGGR